MLYLLFYISDLIVLALLFRLYVKWRHTYWERKKLPYIESNSIWGNMESPLNIKDGFAFNIKNAHDELKRRGLKHGGIYRFTQPAYMPVDIELIKRILVKDFNYFVDHGTACDKGRDPLSAHLFNLNGDDWHHMRAKLTPTFTSGKMRMMFGTLLDCGRPMLEHIDNLIENQKPLDVKDILACYGTDVIGSCAFGLECNSFKEPYAEFRKYGRELLEPSFMHSVRQIAVFSVPALYSLLRVKFVSQGLESFFIDVIDKVIQHRKTHNVKRNDFVQIIIDMNEKSVNQGEEPMTINEISAQAFVFFLGGFETSSTAITFCLHELAYNQDIQDRLREEIRRCIKRHDGKLSYYSLKEMTYMDQVVNETLRKYPAFTMLNRVCTADYNVPDTDVIIEKGTKVFISTLAIHRDEEYYPDPEKFDPERFTEEEKAKRPAFTFLPFGEGPRLCIGYRFGEMQTKTALAMLLNNYRFLPHEDGEYNIKFDPRSFVITKLGQLMLNAQKLS